jgi:hypothetical protein
MNKTIREMMAAQAEADAKAKPRKSHYAKDWSIDKAYINTQAASYDY